VLLGHSIQKEESYQESPARAYGNHNLEGGIGVFRPIQIVQEAAAKIELV